jgi:type IV fimbrial biogenesis protein FimT
MSGNARGFSMVELLVLVAIIGIVSAFALPSFVTYWQGATLRAGAEELMTVLNDARQLAIAQNNSVCVTTSTTTIQYHVGTCGAATYVGPGTDTSGNKRLASAVRITTDPQVVFTYLGGASTAGSYSVQNPVNNTVQTVTVTASGRITIP